MKIRRVILGNPSINRRTVKLPSGKEMVFTKGFCYKTSDNEELDFFSKAGGFQLLRLEEREAVEYLEKLEIVPTIDKSITDEEAKKYLWFDKDEEYVIEELKKRGFIKETTGLDREAILEARKKMRMGWLKDVELLEELNRRNLLPKPEPKAVILKQTDEDMVEALKANGYIAYKKIVK